MDEQQRAHTINYLESSFILTFPNNDSCNFYNSTYERPSSSCYKTWEGMVVGTSLLQCDFHECGPSKTVIFTKS